MDLNLCEIHEHVSCEILITGVCNLQCSYCIAKHVPKWPMSIDIGQKAVDLMFYLSEGAKSIEFIFTGGEPLLEYNTLSHLIEYSSTKAQSSGMDISFVLKTNGTILNSEILGTIQKYDIDVVISIDGNQQIHDKHRLAKNGEKTYEIVSRNLKNLLQNHVKCTASLTVHPDAIQSVLLGIQMLNNLGIKSIDVGPVYGTVKWSDSESLQFSQLLFDIANFVFESKNRGGEINVNPVEKESAHINSILSETWGCHAASSNLAFLPNGQISGCSSLAMISNEFPELIIGNVESGIDQTSLDRLIYLAQCGIEAKLTCKECKTSSNCAGGCLAINYSTSGSAFFPPKFYCETISNIEKAWNIAWRDD
jgi:uncharacterized protein